VFDFANFGIEWRYGLKSSAGFHAMGLEHRNSKGE
jgi:hypothetical protein